MVSDDESSSSNESNTSGSSSSSRDSGSEAESLNVEGLQAEALEMRASPDSASSSDESSAVSTRGTDDEETDSTDVDDKDLPINERLRREEEKGLGNRKRYDKKKQALEVACERLAKFRQQKASEINDKSSQDRVTNQKKKKRSKHAPVEVSSKRADFMARQRQHGLSLNESGLGLELGAHRYKPRDPRQDNLAGHLNIEHFERNYSFLQEVRAKEIATLQKRISARKLNGRKGQKRRRALGITGIDGDASFEKQELKRLLQEQAEWERQKVDREVKSAVKQKLKEQVKESGKVYFPKRRELKRMHMEAKYDQLRKRGGDRAIDKALAKRRKKNKSRDAGLIGKEAEG